MAWYSLASHADSVERKLATGDFRGRLQTWDLDRCEEPLTSTSAHVGLINAIDGATRHGDLLHSPDVMNLG
jgi:hypothetical protein